MDDIDALLAAVDESDRGLVSSLDELHSLRSDLFDLQMQQAEEREAGLREGREDVMDARRRLMAVKYNELLRGQPEASSPSNPEGPAEGHGR